MPSHVADVFKTGLVCATVALLGYLGFSLMQAWMINPALRILTLKSDEMKALQDRMETISGNMTMLEELYTGVEKHQRDAKTLWKSQNDTQDNNLAAISALRKRSDGLERQVNALRQPPGQLPSGTVIEYGSVLFQRPKDYTHHNCQRIEFKNKYKSPPLIFTNQWNTAGHWVAAQAQQVTKGGALICVSLAKQNRHYRCRIAYIVIGQAVQ